MFTSSLTCLFTVGAVICMILPFTWSQLNAVTYYNTPVYCTSIVTSLPLCPPNFCYSGDTRERCCMGIYKTATGSLYQQCHCNSSVSCSAQNPIPTTKANPICCASPLPKTCQSVDACFNSTTRSLCCLGLNLVPLAESGMGLNLTCTCNTQINC
ncbi:hypothetical protein Btru_059787 [Bulinus truncatus]|nr:hypothetical protein Btru_059787 [Bulinus truncatus]